MHYPTISRTPYNHHMHKWDTRLDSLSLVVCLLAPRCALASRILLARARTSLLTRRRVDSLAPGYCNFVIKVFAACIVVITTYRSKNKILSYISTIVYHKHVFHWLQNTTKLVFCSLPSRYVGYLTSRRNSKEPSSQATTVLSTCTSERSS